MTYCRTSSLILGAVALTVPAAAKEAKELKRPNILIAIADDMSFPHTGAYGCPWVNTPAFDYVARNGVLFTNAYTPNAKSAPSRACLLTGRYSWQLEEASVHIGVWPEGKYPTFSEILSDNAYVAAYTGKGWAPGDAGDRLLTGQPYQDKELVPPTTGISKIDYAANFADFLSAKPEGKPWVFWYGSKEPHRAYEYGSGRSKGGKELSDIDRVPSFFPDNASVRNDLLDYAYEIEHFDSHLGSMLRMLEESGELDNTIVIVTADNGMPFPRCKGFEYEYSNHMPLAIMWKKGIADAGRKEEAYVNFVDIAPTILRLSGCDPSILESEGMEMTDILKNKHRKKRGYLLLGQERHDYGRPKNQGYPIRSIIRNGYLYIHNFKADLWPAGDPVTGYLNTDGSPTKTEILNLRRNAVDVHLWQMSFGFRPQEELYYLNSDRECIINLAENPDYKLIKEKLREELFERLRSQDDPRVTGGGELFDSYPFAKRSSDMFYERFVSGKIKKYQTGWVNPSDYEKEEIIMY